MAKDWLPTRLSEQATVFQNVATKLPTFSPGTLGLTAAQVTACVAICNEFVTAYTFVEQSRAAMDAVMKWRDGLYKGTPVGSPAPAAPIFPVALDPAAGDIVGIIAKFREYRDIILAAPGYTEAIGEDLMIVGDGSSSPSIPAHDATPELKVQVGSGYEISVAGPMHGMDAMRVEYLRNNDGNTWNLVGFFTKTPGVVTISPHVPGEPEAGRIRARYIQNNVPVGNYSQEAAVTVSA